MTKTVSARISNELHEQLRDRCNELGRSINDYLAGCLELGLNGTTEVELSSQKQDSITETQEQRGPSVESRPKKRYVIDV